MSWKNEQIKYSENVLYVQTGEATEPQVGEALLRCTKEIETVLGRKIAPILFSVATRQNNTPVGVSFVFARDTAVRNLLKGLNADGSEVCDGKKSEDSDDGWGETKTTVTVTTKSGDTTTVTTGTSGRQDSATTTTVITPTTTMTVKTEKIPAKKMSWYDSDEDEDDVPVAKKVKKVKKSWADEDDAIKKTVDERKEKIVSSEKKVNITKPFYMNGSEKYEFAVYDCILDYPKGFNRNSLFLFKMPEGITVEDLRTIFKPFITNPTKTENGKVKQYPEIKTTRSGSAYINFEPNTEDAFCAIKICTKVKIGKHQLNFKLQRQYE